MQTVSCLTFDRGEKTAARHGSRLKLGNPLQCPLALIEQNVTGLRSPTTEEELWTRKKKTHCFANCAHLSPSQQQQQLSAASLPSRMREKKNLG